MLELPAAGARASVYTESGELEGSGVVKDWTVRPAPEGWFVSAVVVALDDGRVLTRRPQRVLPERLES